ncbi:MAG: FAD-dependent oxidoreductase [Spirochaetota bacterium]|nr:FAD-dependent oxidoreductase [Spirochaetota bacterium]
MNKVIIYSTDICPYCIKAKTFLKDIGINFDVIEVKAGSDKWAEMKEKTSSSSFPQIMIDNKPIGGYSDLVSLHISGKLSEMLNYKKEESKLIYDVIIIGGGPAGLSAAIYTARKLLKTLLISKNIGGQVAETYDIDNYLGFSNIDTAHLVNKFEAHVDKYDVEKLDGVDVTSLELTGKIKKVICSDDKEYLTKTLIIATGKRPKPLNVPGESDLVGKGVAYCSTCDAPLFAGADVAVIGGGNSALEAVIDLEKVANKIYLVSLTELTADQILMEKVSGFSNVDIYTKYDTTRIVGDSLVEGIEIKSLENSEVSHLNVEGVFIEIGLLPNSDLIIDILETNREGEIIIDNICRTGMSGIFACGDVTSIPYKQVIIAAGEGAKAALSVSNYLINQK